MASSKTFTALFQLVVSPDSRTLAFAVAGSRRMSGMNLAMSTVDVMVNGSSPVPLEPHPQCANR